MRSSILSFAASAALLLSGTPALAQLGKAVLFSDGLSPHVDQVFYDHLPPVESSWVFWTQNDIPSACKFEAQQQGFDPADFLIYSIKYVDCGPTWKICRHKDATMSRPVMTDLLGRIPVHERQWLQHIVAMPPKGGNWAYSRDKTLVFLGDVGRPSVFQHETGHTTDSYYALTGASSRASSTAAWATAIRDDTCVPDGYANTNVVEDYAQNSVILLYQIVAPGGLDTIGSWRCLVFQFRAILAFQRPIMIPGGTCDRRWPDSPIVSKAGTGLRIREAATAPEPYEAIRADMSVVVRDQPPKDEGEPVKHVFKNLIDSKAEDAKAVHRQEQWDRAARIKRSKIARGVDLNKS